MTKRPIRIAGASGSASDRRHTILSLARNYESDPVDLIIGDWMSEGNMTGRAWAKTNLNAGSGDPNAIAYEPTFLEAVVPALPLLAKHGIKVAVNAGASDPRGLCEVVRRVVSEKGLRLKVAWIEGDEVLEAVQRRVKAGEEKFENICTGQTLDDWQFEPIYAQAYLGGLGIAEALKRGSDIVIAGRVSDASPVIGGAYWWHNWRRSDLDQLANTFVAGHLIECSTYVTGGNFTGFRGIEAEGWDDLGYPIAEISSSGEVIITKQRGTQGLVTADTCTSQLLYEIQGPWYFNSDVTAILDDLWFEQLSTDRVALRGVKSAPPPPTTKVGLTAKPIYQVEFHFFPCGIDIDAKARMCEAQIRRAVGDHAKKFLKFEFTQNGTAMENPTNQNAATIDFRIFAQARNEEDLAPAKILRPCLDSIMQSYPGSTPHLDFRQGLPKPAYEYYVTLLPQSDIDHKVHLDNGETVHIPPPSVTKVWDKQQPSEAATKSAAELSSFGKTQRGPLGWVVHARSGDKGSNANVGFWVKTEEQWKWLRTLLSVNTVKQLLADEYKQGNRIDRFELPHARAVHFLLHDHLDRGVSCSSSYDFLAKNVAEYLRARHVDIPVKFLAAGRL